MSTRGKRIVLTTALSSTLSLPAPAFAQDERPEEITITAERREGQLLRAPLSIAAFSGPTLDNAGVESTADLSFVIPGLVFTTNSVLGQPYLRGVGSDLITAGADPAIATFVDDIYQARSVAAVQDFFDVERVEVVKGPQGTLFGRNTTGGAIRIFTHDPAPEFAAETDLLYGNFDKLRIRGFINVPVVDDRVLLRISGLRSQRDGFTDDLFLGKDLDDEDYWAIRGKLKVLATNDVTILVSGDYGREESSRFLAAKLEQPLAGSPAFLAGGTVPADPRKVLNDTRPFADVEAWGVSGKISWDSEGVAFQSLTGFRKTRFRETLDLDGTEIAFVSNSVHEHSESFTQEFQLQSQTSGPLEWLAGLYYQHEKASQTLDVRIIPASIRDQPNADLKINAVGVFGEASYRFLDRWKLSAGLRYSYEHKRQDFIETVNGGVVADFDQRDDWDAWTPRVALEYLPNETLLFYASVARGFRSGGYNSTTAQPFPFDPEFLWSYQIGSRWSPWEGRAHLHLAGFFYDYEDMQLQVVSPSAIIPFPLVENAGSATVWGVEAEWFLRPFEGFQLDGALAFLDTRFDDLVAVDPNVPITGPDQSGNRLPKAPKFSVWLGAVYDWSPTSLGTFTARVGYKYQSKIYFDIFQDDFASEPGYGLLGARLSFAVADGGWVLSVFGENLTDELYAQSNIRLDGTLGNLFFWGAPRTYGFQVAFHY